MQIGKGKENWESCYFIICGNYSYLEQWISGFLEVKVFQEDNVM